MQKNLLTEREVMKTLILSIILGFLVSSCSTDTVIGTAVSKHTSTFLIDRTCYNISYGNNTEVDSKTLCSHEDPNITIGRRVKLVVECGVTITSCKYTKVEYLDENTDS